MYENETLSVIIYFFNKFSKAEAMAIWGGDEQVGLGAHLWNKYQGYLESHGCYGAPTIFICELDSANYNLLIERACSIYNGRKTR